MDDYKYLDCYTGYIEDSKLYLVSVSFGIVMEYNLDDFSCKALIQINLPDPCQPVRVTSIIKADQFLYVTLWNSWNVFEYDLRNQQMKVYGNDFEYIDGKELTEKSCLYQNKIWLFPCEVKQRIRIFNIKTKRFDISISIEEILNRKGYKVEEDSLICLDIFQKECKCILAVYNNPFIIEMNLETKKHNVYEVKPFARIEDMFYVDGQYWISYIDSKIIDRWSPTDGILETYEPQNIHIQEEWKYRYIFSYKEKVIIFPIHDEKICIIDKKTRKETVLEYSRCIQRVHNRERWLFYGLVKYNNKILLLPYSMTCFISFDLQEEQFEFYPGKLGADVIYEYYIKPGLSDRLLMENSTFEFSEYLELITKYHFDINGHKSGSGEKIWMQLR